MKKKELMIKLEDGTEMALSTLLKESTIDGLKEMGIPLNESGKFEMKNLPVEVKTEADQKLERIESAANFVKSMIVPADRHKEYGVKAINTQAGSFGNTIPTELAEQILEKRKKFAVLRGRAFSFEMAGNFDLPKEGTGVTGYWVAENAEVTESNPTIDKLSFGDYYLASRVVASWKLLNTSAFNIVNYIATLSGKALAETEETAFIGGDGSSKPTGIRQASITGIAQAGASYSYDDLVALYYALPAKYRKNAVFMTSSKGAQLINALKDSNDRPIFQPGMPMDEVLKRPILESEDVPANLGTGTDETEIYFGDPFYYWIKDGQGLEMETDKIISKLQTEIVLYQAIDGKVVDTDAFRKSTGIK